MQVWKSIVEWRRRREAIAQRTVGFVPTMGALHPGHGSLVERCRAENEVAVVSVFVNPTQFNDPKDLSRYPSTLEHDLDMLESLGADDVIMPSKRELYPNGYLFRIEPESSGLTMEGLHRPGFLQGVLTIVMKLLNLVQADRSYFGEKDFQQLQAVTEMARDFFLKTRIVPCTTVREASGLAMSSRNALLSAGAHATAPALYRALTQASNCAEARSIMESSGFKVDYVEEHWGRRFAAAFLDGVRLIDNVPVKGED